MYYNLNDMKDATFEMTINGAFEFTVCILNTEVPVDNDIAEGVLDNLQQGEYIVGIRTRKIFDINDLTEPLYSFVLEPTDFTDYDFDEI